MAKRLILPDFIVAQFIPPNACKNCGASDGPFVLLMPQVRWFGAKVELIYPLRCPCGGSGCVPIRLPILLFGYILANAALVEARQLQRSKATMRVSRARKAMLMDIFRRFDELTRPCEGDGKRAHIAKEASPPEWVQFGMDEAEWSAFLRRMGFGQN